MNIARSDPSTRPNTLRLWPGVTLAVLVVLARFVAPIVLPQFMVVAVLGAVAGGLAIVVWWAFLSRAPALERWGATALMIVAVAVMPRFVHASIVEGNLGLLFYLYGIPVLGVALVVGAAIGRNLPTAQRRATLVAALLLASGAWTLLRTDGLAGDGTANFAWRWAETSEQSLLAQAGDEPEALPPVPEEASTDAEWPGFRGPDRDGIVRGVRIETDWEVSPPVELWRRPVGPGVSSFAVHGDLLYTQEQRGDDEVVSSYRVATGEPVWRHRDPVRFSDPHVGAGPRATPALADGRVYTIGATGILNALDAGKGNVMWSRNAASDTEGSVPQFAVTSSPLVVDDVVIVAVSGRLAAYDLVTGEPRWLGPEGGPAYSSPHLVTIGGVVQVLLGARSVAPADGTVLWELPAHASTILQPALVADDELLFSEVAMMGASGMHRIGVGHGSGGWIIEERWMSSGFKPYFNDIVVHEGHAYGVDGSILACLDLANGERRWKGGRYGHGQFLLLPDQDLILVLSEKGDVALVAASPGGFTELARRPAIEGRTWNHPALVGDILLVRNSEEMAAFRLVLAPDG